MRKGYPTQDYHRIMGNPTHGIYYGAGIPAAAWPEKKDEIIFKLFVHDDKTLSPKSQEEWFACMKSGILFKDPVLTLISSDVDDNLSTMQGYEIMKSALLKQKRIQITESSSVKAEETSDESVFMLTNIYDEAPPDRLQLVRDWCYRHEDSFRILCTAGDPSVLVRKLRLQFNGIIYLDSKSVSEKSFA